MKKVREIMVPRIDIFALDIHTPLEEIREKVASAGHSRVPVYDGSIDRIVGMLYVKDLLKILAGETFGSTGDGSSARRTSFPRARSSTISSASSSGARSTWPSSSTNTAERRES